MNDNEMHRIITWLRESGHTFEEVADCLYYISKGKHFEEPEKENKKEK